MKRYLVTGTGTGIGKSFFSAFFARMLLDAGKSVRYVKPVATGYPDDDDAAFVARYAGLGPEDAVTLYTAAEPASPCFVFDPFPFDACVSRIESLAVGRDVLLVETAGGLGVPLTDRHFNYHFAPALGLDVILVVPNRLGCLSDAKVYADFILRHDMALTAMALNDHFAESPRHAARNAAELERQFPGKVACRYDDAGLRCRGFPGLDAAGREG